MGIKDRSLMPTVQMVEDRSQKKEVNGRTIEGSGYTSRTNSRARTCPGWQEAMAGLGMDGWQEVMVGLGMDGWREAMAEPGPVRLPAVVVGLHGAVPQCTNHLVPLVCDARLCFVPSEADRPRIHST